MLAEAEAAVRAEKIAARRAALGERVRELAAKRVSAVASKATADALRGATTTFAKAAASAQKRPTKLLKREKIRARRLEGRVVVSEPHTTEEPNGWCPRRAARWR
jgi:hypothetical protein